MIDKISELAESVKAIKYELISTYEDGYIGKRVYKVTLANGKTKKVERIIKDGSDGDAVVILPITKNGKVLIEVQSRPNMLDTGGVAVEFPAGMVDRNESYLTAAKRELLEETGYISNNWRELEWHYQDQGCSNAIIKTYIALDCEHSGHKRLDSDEVLESIEVTVDELYDLVDKKLINDASSKIAIMTYFSTRKKV